MHLFHTFFTLKTLTRGFSGFIAFTFLVQQLAFALGPQAAPMMVMPPQIANIIQSPEQIQVPLNFASLKDMHRGTNGKLIIHIQDAHTNFSGQKNIAKTLDALMQSHGMSLVLSEGSAKDSTLTPLKSLTTQKHWTRIANKFMREGVLTGEEYLNLTSDHDMKIMGIENQKLYDHNVSAYAALKSHRQSALTYLHRINISLSRIKAKLYPNDLTVYETNLNKDERTDFNHQIQYLFELALKHNIQISNSYPNVKYLKKLHIQEKSIDFQKINQEQSALYRSLESKGHEAKVKEFIQSTQANAGSTITQFNLFNQLMELAKANGISTDNFPELRQYFSYLKDFSDLNMDALLGELEVFEDEVYKTILSTSDDAKRVRVIDRFLKLLDKAYRIQMSSKDFQMLLANEGDFKTLSWEAFLNTKLVDLDYFEELIPYKSHIEDAAQNLHAFYEIVDQRDEAFIKNTHDILEAEGKDSAFLIAGGYHTSNLMQLFEEEGYSYIVLTPMVTQETNHDRYEDLLLSQAEGMNSRDDVAVEYAPIKDQKNVVGNESTVRHGLIINHASMAGQLANSALDPRLPPSARLSKLRLALAAIGIGVVITLGSYRFIQLNQIEKNKQANHDKLQAEKVEHLDKLERALKRQELTGGKNLVDPAQMPGYIHSDTELDALALRIAQEMIKINPDIDGQDIVRSITGETDHYYYKNVIKPVFDQYSDDRRVSLDGTTLPINPPAYYVITHVLKNVAELERKWDDDGNITFDNDAAHMAIKITDDYGYVDSWENAFDKGKELLQSGHINAFAPLSLDEFNDLKEGRAMIFGSPLDGSGMGMSSEQYYDMMADMSPQLYTNNVGFRLFRTALPVNTQLHDGSTEARSFVIVYLKEGEEADYTPGDPAHMALSERFDDDFDNGELSNNPKMSKYESMQVDALIAEIQQYTSEDPMNAPLELYEAAVQHEKSIEPAWMLFLTQMRLRVDEWAKDGRKDDDDFSVLKSRGTIYEYFHTSRYFDPIWKKAKIVDFPRSPGRGDVVFDSEESVISEIDPPLVKAVQILYTKGVTAYASSANSSDLEHQIQKNGVWISFKIKGLSDENQERVKAKYLAGYTEMTFDDEAPQIFLDAENQWLEDDDRQALNNDIDKLGYEAYWKHSHDFTIIFPFDDSTTLSDMSERVVQYMDDLFKAQPEDSESHGASMAKNKDFFQDRLNEMSLFLELIMAIADASRRERVFYGFDIRDLINIKREALSFYRLTMEENAVYSLMEAARQVDYEDDEVESSISSKVVSHLYLDSHAEAGGFISSVYRAQALLTNIFPSWGSQALDWGWTAVNTQKLRQDTMRGLLGLLDSQKQKDISVIDDDSKVIENILDRIVKFKGLRRVFPRLVESPGLTREYIRQHYIWQSGDFIEYAWLRALSMIDYDVDMTPEQFEDWGDSTTEDYNARWPDTPRLYENPTYGTDDVSDFPNIQGVVELTPLSDFINAIPMLRREYALLPNPSVDGRDESLTRKDYMSQLLDSFERNVFGKKINSIDDIDTVIAFFDSLVSDIEIDTVKAYRNRQVIDIKESLVYMQSHMAQGNEVSSFRRLTTIKNESDEAGTRMATSVSRYATVDNRFTERPPFELNSTLIDAAISTPNVSRRLFLKASAATVASGVVAPGLALGQEAGKYPNITSLDEAAKFVLSQRTGMNGRALPNTWHVPQGTRIGDPDQNLLIREGVALYDTSLAIISLVEAGKKSDAASLLRIYSSGFLGEMDMKAMPNANNNGSFTPFNSDAHYLFNFTRSTGRWGPEWKYWNVHTGPNAWLVLAIAKYTDKFNDKTFLPLAEKIARAMLILQDGQALGGVRYGPKGQAHPSGDVNRAFNEINTENNVSAASAFLALEKVTGKKIYGAAAAKILKWFTSADVYNPETRKMQKGLYNTANHSLYMGAEYDARARRWQIQPVFAADSAGSWTASALHPSTIDKQWGEGAAFKMMQTVRKGAGRTSNFERTGLTKPIAGIDFTDKMNGRLITQKDALISIEWTAGFIRALELLVRHYEANPTRSVTKEDIVQMKTDIKTMTAFLLGNPNPYAVGPGLTSSRRGRTLFGWQSSPVNVTATASIALHLPDSLAWWSQSRMATNRNEVLRNLSGKLDSISTPSIAQSVNPREPIAFRPRIANATLSLWNRYNLEAAFDLPRNVRSVRDTGESYGLLGVDGDKTYDTYRAMVEDFISQRPTTDTRMTVVEDVDVRGEANRVMAKVAETQEDQEIIFAHERGVTVSDDDMASQKRLSNVVRQANQLVDIDFQYELTKANIRDLQLENPDAIIIVITNDMNLRDLTAEQAQLLAKKGLVSVDGEIDHLALDLAMIELHQYARDEVQEVAKNSPLLRKLFNINDLTDTAFLKDVYRVDKDADEDETLGIAHVRSHPARLSLSQYIGRTLLSIAQTIVMA